MGRKALDEVLQDDYKEKAQEIRLIADSMQIECNQTHAPFPSFIDGDPVYNERIAVALARAVEVSGILGAKNCVMHPTGNCGIEKNISFFKRLEPFAKKTGVRIAIENVYTCDSEGNIIPADCSYSQTLRAILDGLDENCFGICLDVGHAALTGNVVETIYDLGKRIIAVHFHDVDLVHDNHSLPFMQKVEYAPILDAFRSIGYEGDMTLEVSIPENLPREIFPDFVKYMASVANYLKKKTVC